MGVPTRPSKFPGLQGGVNPISDQKIGPRIDLKTSTTDGLLKYLASNIVFKDNFLEGVAQFKGQVLRVQNPKVDKVTDNTYFRRVLNNIVGNNYLICKVRIDEVHAFLPIPETYDETEPDEAIIDLYPDFIFEPQNGEITPVSVGDIVNTTFGNLSNYTEGKILYKISGESDGQGSRPPIGSKAEKELGSARDGFNSREPAKTKEDLEKIKNLNKKFDTNKITLDDFKKIFNNSSDSEKYYTAFLRLFKKYQVDTPAKVAGMVGQICIETGNLKVISELPSKYNKVNPRDPNEPIGSLYEKRATLGNTQDGDGPRFIGRGVIQLTGRANYTDAYKALGADIVNNPELVATSPDLAVETGFMFFKNKNLWKFCEENNFDEVTRRVNGEKMLHKETRFSYTLKALEILDKYAA